MNREHPSSERLQRDFDGELAPDESVELRAHLAECLECTAQQASLDRLRSLVTMTVQVDAAQLDSDRMFAAILHGIARDAAVNNSTRDAAVNNSARDAAVNNVALNNSAHDVAVNNVAVDAADSVQSSTVRDTKRALPNQITATAPTTANVPARARVAPVHRLRHINRAAPALGAIALAAGVLLMVNHLGNGSPDNLNEETYEAAEGHSEVVQVDFGYNAGTVFDISLSDGSSIPVVWIDDDDDDEE